MMNLQQHCITLVNLLLFAILCTPSGVQSRVPSKQTSKYASIIKLLHGRAKKDEIGRKREHSSKRDEVLSQNYMQNLEQKFEAIKDLGNIYRCKMHHSETVVTGNNVLCNGKRFEITPEAARDIERPASLRQGILQSPNGEPQDLMTTFNGGLYGQPVASFLGENYESSSYAFQQEPHEKYPMLGIYDPAMRSLGQKFTARTNVFPMTANRDHSLRNDIQSLTNGQMGNILSSESRNSGEMELGDLSQSLQYDENDEMNMKQFGDYTAQNDNFYRDSRMQMDAFGLNGVTPTSHNPFGQYWRSLKSNFYDTTASQLGEQDPSANSGERIFEKAEAKTKIPTKKSNIQAKKTNSNNNNNGNDKKRTIPKPDTSSKATEAKNNQDQNSQGKRYLIYGQTPPMGMFPRAPFAPAGMPGFNPMQMFAGQPQNRIFSPYNNVPVGLLNNQVGPSFNNGPEQGFARSLIGGFNQAPQQGPIGGAFNQGPPAGPPGSFNTGFNPSPQPGFARSFGPVFNPSPQPGFARSFDTGFNQPLQPGFTRPFGPEINQAPQQGITRSFGFPYGQNLGSTGEPSRFASPFLAGGVSRMPLNGKLVRELSQRIGGEPGHPRKGVMQYGIQPDTKRPPFLGFVPVPIMQPMPVNYQGSVGTEVDREHRYGPSETEETLEQAAQRSITSQDDASKEYESLTDPQMYLPSRMYHNPSYNPHESEDLFPDGTAKSDNAEESKYLQETAMSQDWEKTQLVDENAGAGLYSAEMGQEEGNGEEGASKRGLSQGTHLDIHGNHIDNGPNGKMMFTKDHVGFGPITVEAKTAHSAMKDPSDDDD